MDDRADVWEREPTYSSVEVCKAAGVTYRQLDYWDRTGVVSPSVSANGSGTQRRYTVDDAVAVALVGATHDIGGTLARGALGVAISDAPLALVANRRDAHTQRVRPTLVPVADLDEVIATIREHGAAGIIDVEGIRARVILSLRADESVAA